MKKTVLAFLSLFVICTISLIAFAGSIDVDLLSDDEALVFIGSVNDYTVTYEEDDYPYTEYSLTVTPNEKIKGDVIAGKSIDFEKVGMGSIKLQKDSDYLFGYMKDELYIWELEAYKDLFDWELDDYTKESIILKERHNDTISAGMQRKLNEGDFTRAEEERQNTVNQISFDTDKDELSKSIKDSNITSNSITVFGTIALAVVIILFTGFFVIKK